MDLKEKAKKLPEQPGVYLMKDHEGNIIYVGKAKSLKNRVSQYFQNSSRHAPKILRMVEGIRDFDNLFADTELEALLLECRLIKDLKPLYNSQLKNHLKYVYIRIDFSEPYPTLELTGSKEGKGSYFGPYNSLHHVERVLQVIKENWRLRHCRSFSSRKTGCLNHQLGYCIGPCTGEVNREDYGILLTEVEGLLKSGKTDLLKKLEAKMKAAAEVLDFDKAAKYRDDIGALQHVLNKQKTIRFSQSSRCMVALEQMEGRQYKLFILKGGRIVYKERFELSEHTEKLEERIRELIARYKPLLQKKENIEVEKGEIDQAQILFSYLKNKKECSYLLIPRNWMSSKESEKLYKGIREFVGSLNF